MLEYFRQARPRFADRAYRASRLTDGMDARRKHAGMTGSARGLVFVWLQTLRARQLADEVLRLVDQRGQALRADVRRAGFNGER